MKCLTIFSIFLTLSLIGFGQDTPEKHKSQAYLFEFKQFMVTSEPVQSVKDTHIYVRAIYANGDFYTAKAIHATPEVIEATLINFRGVFPIIDIYSGQFDINGVMLDFYLVGYRDEKSQQRYFLLDSYDDGPEEAMMIDAKTFEWSNSRTVKN